MSDGMLPPEVPDDLAPYYQAWEALSRTRPVGMGAQGLSYVEITAWLDLQGIDELEIRQEFAFFITGIDNHWVKLAREEAERQRKTKGKKPRGTRNRRPTKG